MIFYCPLCKQPVVENSTAGILFRCECKALRIQTASKKFRLLCFINLYKIIIKQNGLEIFSAAIMENNNINEAAFLSSIDPNFINSLPVSEQKYYSHYKINNFTSISIDMALKLIHDPKLMENKNLIQKLQLLT
jgi:hypothetical protein